MNKLRKVLLTVILVMLLILIGIGVLYLFRDKEYQLYLPDQELIVSFNIEQNSNSKLISTEEDIINVYNVIKGDNRLTVIPSKDESFGTINNIVIINLNYEEKVASTYYLYLKDNTYYLEQPLNGIYEVTKNEYEQILEYL